MSQSENEPGAAPRVLVADDNTFSRRMIVAALDSLGCQVAEAASGRETIAQLCQVPRLKLVSLDLQMSDMTGFEVLEQLHTPAVAAALAAQGNERTPVIIMTGSDSQDLRLQGFNLGAVDFVVKSQALDGLIETARQILNPSDEFKGMGVLIVDDSKTARCIAATCLSRLGLRIFEADDGISAVEILQNHAAAIDLILTDFRMKHMNGDRLCRMIRSDVEIAHVPVLFASGSVETGRSLDMFQAGATDYLQKPFLKEELIARVSVHLRHAKTLKEQASQLAELAQLREAKTRLLKLAAEKIKQPLSQIRKESDEPEAALLRAMKSLESFSQDVSRLLDAGSSSSPGAGAPERWWPESLQILLADDNLVNRTVAVKNLKRLGHAVTTAETGRQAVELVRQSLRDHFFDCILMDIEMPDMNGLEATTSIRAMERADSFTQASTPALIPIIAMTAHHTDKQHEECMKAGMSAVMTKPIHWDQFHEVLARLQRT